MNDRLSDFARARLSDRDPRVGSGIVSAEVVRFVPRPRRGASNDSTDFPTIAFRLPSAAADRADTAPCEYVAPDHDEG
jgi:hypothetical protein